MVQVSICRSGDPRIVQEREQDGRERGRTRPQTSAEDGYNGIVQREKAKTFPIAAKRWLDSRLTHVAPKTVDLYELAIDHLKKHFGGLLLSDISAADIASYQGKRTGNGLPGARSIWK